MGGKATGQKEMYKIRNKKRAMAVGGEGLDVVTCVVCHKVGLGKIRGARLLFVFIQLSGLDFNLQSDWEPLKRLNLGSDVILIAFLQNYCGQNAKDERRRGETEDRKIAKEAVILSDLQKLVKVRENTFLSENTDREIKRRSFFLSLPVRKACYNRVRVTDDNDLGSVRAHIHMNLFIFQKSFRALNLESDFQV